MNPAALIKACNEKSSLEAIANAGCASIPDAVEFLKNHFKDLSDDGQDNYGGIEYDFEPEVEKTPEDYCFAHDAYELRSER